VSRRAGLYLRISKDLHQGAAVERQREDGNALIAARGWTLHREYVDNDLSASGRRRRPGFEQLLTDLANGLVDVVVAHALDRLTRNRRDQLRLIETCQDQGALVALVRGTDIDMSSAAGRLFADMLGTFARHEIEVKSERHIRQIAQAAQAGRMVGGRRAFGYSPDGLHLDPQEAPLVARAYRRFLTGESLGSIARWWDSAGARTPQGNRWSFQSVREVLANPRNAGIRGMRPVVNRRTGTRSQWHEEIGPAVWPAIVDEATWRAAMRWIKDPARPGNHEGRNGQRWLLSGIAECGLCGAKLITGTGKGARGSYRTLRCSNVRHLNRRADYIEAWVEAQLVGWFTAPGQAVLGAGAEAAVDLAEVRADAVAVREQLAGLAVDYADGVLSREQVQVASQRLHDRLAALDEQVAAAGQVDVLAPLRGAPNPAAVWAGMGLAARREAVRRLVRVVVAPGRPGRPGGQRFHPDTVTLLWR